MISTRLLPLLSQLAAVLGAATLAQAQALHAPEVPEPLRAPPGAKLVLMAHASGWQVYACRRAADGSLKWDLQGPDAELRDAHGALIGTHFKGPSWRHQDGSQVTGKAVGRVDAPEASAVAWLLLTAIGHDGSGVLAEVTHIQRVNTRGGQPPATAPCDAAHESAEVRSPYRADYYFYVSPGQP